MIILAPKSNKGCDLRLRQPLPIQSDNSLPDLAADQAVAGLPWTEGRRFLQDRGRRDPLSSPAIDPPSSPNDMVFRIELPAYRGPLDLLLYLVRRHEVSLNEMPLATIVDQYLQYIDVLRELDLGDVGDFIDLASTLVELKSQSVLPKVDEPSEEDEIVDPQSELVERLLQYKEIRDAAAVLDEMGSRWQQRYQRMSDDLPTRRVDPGEQPIVDLQIWDLVSAFGRIMREAGGPPQTEVIYDDTPIHVYMQRIHHRLGAAPKVPLMDLIEGGLHKSSLIGWFLATLELTRHHGAAVEQDAHGDIYVVRTVNYSENLDVNEIDNYGTEEFEAAQMPGRPR